MTTAGAKTFVLVHGAWHGGWCWRGVADNLRGRGHTVFAPTQTGLGERAHLISKTITLDTFIEDIVNVIGFERLQDAILVGHSFAGSTISGVADRMPERIRRLVYLDALTIENGQTPMSALPKDVVEARMKQAESSGGVSIPAPPASAFGIADPAQARSAENRFTPHPLSTYTSPLKLVHPVGNGLPMTYIVCGDPVYAPLQTSRDWAKAHGMTMTSIAAGHSAMLIAPDALADMLDGF